MASRGQCFSTVLVEGRATKESAQGLANIGALSMTDGGSTFMVDVQNIWALEILIALVPHVLSNMGALLSQSPFPQP